MDANRLEQLRRNRGVEDAAVARRKLVERLDKYSLYNGSVRTYKKENESKGIELPYGAYAILDKCIPQAVSIYTYITNQYGNKKNQEILRIARIVKTFDETGLFNDLCNVFYEYDSDTENILASLQQPKQSAANFCDNIIKPVKGWWPDENVGALLVDTVYQSVLEIGIDESYYLTLMQLNDTIDVKALNLLLAIVETAGKMSNLKPIMDTINETRKADKRNMPAEYVPPSTESKGNTTLDEIVRISNKYDSEYNSSLGITPVTTKLEEVITDSGLFNYIDGMEEWKNDEEHLNILRMKMTGNKSNDGLKSHLFMIASTVAMFDESEIKKLNSESHVEGLDGGATVFLSSGLSNRQSHIFRFNTGYGIIADSATHAVISFSPLEYEKSMSLIRLAKRMM